MGSLDDQPAFFTGRATRFFGSSLVFLDFPVKIA
jgi:hypothetical protein